MNYSYLNLNHMEVTWPDCHILTRTLCQLGSLYLPGGINASH